MRKEQFYEIVTIEPSTKAIVQLVEEKTGKGFEFVEKSNLSVSASVKIARSFMSDHIVAFKSENHGRLSHLIAHECGHILRYYSVPADKRIVPGTSRENQDKANYWIEKTGRKKLNKLPPNAVPKLKEIWIGGFIRLLTNIPVDYRIETWLHNDYPDLSEAQISSLDADYSTALAGASKKIETMTPDIIYNKTNLINCVFYTALDRGLGTSYAKGFKKFCKGKRPEKLLAPLMNDDQGFVQDIETINEWAEVLNVAEWFRWGDFENVPDNYVNLF